MKVLLLLALAIILSPATAATADTIHLLCQGRGSVRVSRTFRLQFIDSVQIEVEEAGGRILMPRELWRILTGGKDGWYNLEKIVKTEVDISANVDAGLFDHARVSIDRTSGIILIQAMDGTYSGRCKRYTPDDLYRKF